MLITFKFLIKYKRSRQPRRPYSDSYPVIRLSLNDSMHAYSTIAAREKCTNDPSSSLYWGEKGRDN